MQNDADVALAPSAMRAVPLRLWPRGPTSREGAGVDVGFRNQTSFRRPEAYLCSRLEISV